MEKKLVNFKGQIVVNGEVGEVGGRCLETNNSDTHNWVVGEHEL